LRRIPYGGIYAQCASKPRRHAFAVSAESRARCAGSPAWSIVTAYCIDILTQIAAVRAALRRVEEEILEDHVGHCVEHAITSGNRREQRRKVNELIDVLARTHR